MSGRLSPERRFRSRRNGKGVDVAVCVKSIVDPEAGVHILEGGSEVAFKEPWRLRMLNPVDLIATAIALHLLATVPESAVRAVTVDDPDSERDLFDCAAMGVSRILRIQAEQLPEQIDALATAEILFSYFRENPADLILCGLRSLDGASGAIGPALATHLGWPMVSGVEWVEWIPRSQKLIVRSHLGRGVKAELAVRLPVLLIVEPGRSPYVSGYRRLKASRQTAIERMNLPLDGILKARTHIQEYAQPRPRTRRGPVPESKLPAAARIRQLVEASGTPSRPEAPGARIVEGPAPELARVLLGYLKDHGFLE